MFVYCIIYVSDFYTILHDYYIMFYRTCSICIFFFHFLNCLNSFIWSIRHWFHALNCLFGRTSAHYQQLKTARFEVFFANQFVHTDIIWSWNRPVMPSKYVDIIHKWFESQICIIKIIRTDTDSYIKCVFVKFNRKLSTVWQKWIYYH